MQYFLKTKLNSLITSVIAPPSLVGRNFTLSYGAFSLSFKQELQNYWREQWWHGYAGDGRIGSYAKSTIKRKMKKGLPYDRVTLFETGNLYNSLYTRVESDGIVIGTNVDYFVSLQNRYRGVLFKLHDDRKRQLADEIIKKIKETWLKKK